MRFLRPSNRRALCAAWLVAAGASLSASAARACTPGEETCPVVLKMQPGAVSITATGSVSGEHPNYYFTFEARAGQKMTIHVVGGNIKTGPGIPITLPNGDQNAVDENVPFTLPATGAYVIVMHANTMSDGPFGRFTTTLTIR